VITTAAMNEAAKSAWCREHGVYPAELDTVTLSELCQLHRALSLGQQVQAFDHHAVEIEQVLLTHVAQGLREQLAIQNIDPAL
jgi:hypothetical protein